MHSEDEKTMEKVIFLDRDGTLNAEVNYLHRPEDLQLLPGVPEALRRLKEAGYKLVVVTNQAGVARGYYKEADVDILHRYMNEILAADGAEIDAFFSVLTIRSMESEIIKKLVTAGNLGLECSFRQNGISPWKNPIPT